MTTKATEKTTKTTKAKTDGKAVAKKATPVKKPKKTKQVLCLAKTFVRRFADKLNERHDGLVTQAEAQRILEDYYAVLTDVVIGERQIINLGNLGRLRVRAVAERQARNPQTGEMITVPARHRLTFRPSSANTHL